MRMYGALLLALVTGYFWPEVNVFEVPFAELTLKLIIGTGIAAWLAYVAVMLGFSSFEKDRFWPWKWTRPVIKTIAVRVGWLVAFFGGAAVFMSGWPKFNTLVNEYPVISALIAFVVLSFCICAEDKDFEWETESEALKRQQGE